KNCTDSLKKTPRRHQAERGQCTRFKVIHTESIVHADDDSLLSDEGHMHPPPRTIFFSPDGIKEPSQYLYNEVQSADSCATLKGSRSTITAKKTDISQMSSGEV